MKGKGSPGMLKGKGRAAPGHLRRSTHFELHLLKVQYSDLWNFIDDIKSIMLLIGYRVS